MKLPNKAFVVLADSDGKPLVGYEFPVIDSWDLYMEDDPWNTPIFSEIFRIRGNAFKIRLTLESHVMIQHAPSAAPEPDWTPQPKQEIEPPQKEVEA